MLAKYSLAGVDFFASQLQRLSVFLELLVVRLSVWTELRAEILGGDGGCHLSWSANNSSACREFSHR